MRVCVRCIRHCLALSISSLFISSGYFIIFYLKAVIFSDFGNPAERHLLHSDFDTCLPDRHILQESEVDHLLECVQPTFALDNKPYEYHPVEPISCPVEDNWVYIDNGTFRISKKAVDRHGQIQCAFGPILRDEDDINVTTGKALFPWLDGQQINTDIFRIKCLAADGTKHANIHSAISLKTNVVNRSVKNSSSEYALGLNVLMFGLDSMSRLGWMQQLPKTFEYLSKDLKGIVLKGYNIVGDGTPQALLPILTGHSEAELPEARRGHPGAKQVDAHPWIWRDYSKAGYVTQWGEDGAAYGTFQYRMLGFKHQPVDYYLRPFYLSVEKLYKYFQPYCVGSVPRHVNMLRWIMDLYHMYPNRRKFSFLFHSEFTHDSTGMLPAADVDIQKFLQNMEEQQYLNNTVLILMADHGPRYNGARRTIRGKYEERMPFFSFRFPPWFEVKYPLAIKNFRRNVQRLTTPFDIHETLKEIINFTGVGKGHVTKRGISLFKEIPAGRSCSHAGIAPHWCSCLKWESVGISDVHVNSAAAALVRAINHFTSKYRQLCHLLYLDAVLGAVKYAPDDKMLRFKRSKDTDGREADMTDNMAPSEVLYQVTIVTKPSSAKYEATIKYLVDFDEYKVNDREISRINKYGNQPHCIMRVLPHLRKYCFCIN